MLGAGSQAANDALWHSRPGTNANPAMLPHPTSSTPQLSAKHADLDISSFPLSTLHLHASANMAPSQSLVVCTYSEMWGAQADVA